MLCGSFAHDKPPPLVLCGQTACELVVHPGGHVRVEHGWHTELTNFMIGVVSTGLNGCIEGIEVHGIWIISNHNQTINIQVQAAAEHALTQHHHDVLNGKQSINGEANLRLNVVDFPGSELYVDNLGVLRKSETGSCFISRQQLIGFQ